MNLGRTTFIANTLIIVKSSNDIIPAIQWLMLANSSVDYPPSTVGSHAIQWPKRGLTQHARNTDYHDPDRHTL